MQIQTIVIVEEVENVRGQADYFFHLLKPLLVKSMIQKDYAVIETETHHIRIIPKRMIQRGHKSDYVLNLTKQDEFNGTNEYMITINRGSRFRYMEENK